MNLGDRDNMEVRRPCVLHLAVDYPSRNRPINTEAVRRLVTSNPDLEYRVVALTRVADPRKCNSIDGDDQGDVRVLSMNYWGFPLGVLLNVSMWLAAKRIYREMCRRDWQPDLIHAHKLTFEGLIGYHLARWCDVPLAVSVRGEAESKVLKYKPHFRWRYQQIINRCARIFYVSAWFKPILNQNFNISSQKEYLLPNFVSERALRPLSRFRENHLVTVLDLNVYRKKGLDKLLLAFGQLLANGREARLDIIGQGAPEVRVEVEGLINTLGLAESVRLLGAFGNEELLLRLPEYAGLALPSQNETFGMVYVEALLSGVPILYSIGTGIDGFVDWIPAKVGVDPRAVESIGSGLAALLESQTEYRSWLLENHQQVLNAFLRDAHLSAYTEFVKATCRCV